MISDVTTATSKCEHMFATKKTNMHFIFISEKKYTNERMKRKREMELKTKIRCLVERANERMNENRCWQRNKIVCQMSFELTWNFLRINYFIKCKQKRKTPERRKSKGK